MSLRTKGRSLTVATALLGGLALVAPSTASAHQSSGQHHGLAVQQVNLVSDVPGQAPLLDPDLVNPWGLSLGATSPLWSSNEGTSSSTLYSSAPGATTATKVPTVRVTVPQPTGQVNNASATSFLLSNGTVSAPARFIFATLTGQIAAWGPPITPLIGAAEIKATVPGAAYTGLAIATASKGDQLYAANFAQGKIDVFDNAFQLVKQPWWAFRDFRLPSSYHPFNVQTLNGRIFVAYAKFDPQTGDEVAGRGQGFVDEYTVDGHFVDRIASRGSLNAPWGLAIAPAAWGKDAGSLLIGNFGDGRINVVKAKSHGRFDHKIDSQVKDTHGHTLVIPGLWALLPGTATTGGTDSVWFSAGIADETHGLLGVLRHP
ncbi:TIGR03118 family protein [Kribbella qitaiheensis]|uniref:TIGR03118 family protein n=1 Tax=Kribbella qitaiheensis TaxID=1544730 RepID=A0A7G6X032_9ACTN|nr:TIGR03118 family protein [Kribbella qitaiheensis]QNE19597.1 TIGR03118 family protein [Kribbella qitaiheensis]